MAHNTSAERMLEPLAVSVPEAGRLLGVSERQAWHLVKTGDIPTVRLGGRRVVVVAELHAILSRGGIPLRNGDAA